MYDKIKDTKVEYFNSLSGYFNSPNEKHNNFASNLKNYDFFSIITVEDSVQDFEDKKYGEYEYDIWVSIVEEEARKNLVNKYYSDEDIKEICNKFEIEYLPKNTEFLDSFYKMQSRLEEFKIIERYKQTTKYKLDKDEEDYIYSEDENGNEVIEEISEEEFQEKWKIKLEKILSPRVNKRFERYYHNLPHPLNYWDKRNCWQQHFFCEKENIIYSLGIGGSGSSGQRENQGLLSYTFATLEEKYNKKIPTQVLRYTSNNEIKSERMFDSFYAVDRELFASNYKGYTKELYKSLFKNRLIHINFDVNTMQTKVVFERKI